MLRLALMVVAGLAIACGTDRGSGPPRGGAGGAGEAGGGGASGNAGAACDGVRVTGTLDGATIDTTLLDGGLADGSFLGNRWSYNLLFAEGSVLSLRGDATTKPATGSPVSGKGYFATPPSSVFGGLQIAVSQVSMGFLDLSQPIELDGLSKVGTCPGTPVSGSIELCSSSVLGPDCSGYDVHLSGSVDGAALSEGYDLVSSTWFAGPVEYMHVLLPPDGELWVHDYDSGAHAGYLVFPQGSSRQAQALCVGAATISEVGELRMVALSSLSLAGSVPGESVTGLLEVGTCTP